MRAALLLSLFAAAALAVALAAEAGAEAPSRPGPNPRFAEVQDDWRADSGGCTPETDWEHYGKVFMTEHRLSGPGGDHWGHWEARLPTLAAKVAKASANERAAMMLEAMGESNYWYQILDGWTQHKGSDSFGAAYVEDAIKAQRRCAEMLRKGLTRATFGYEQYGEIHNIAFKQTATELGKRNGFRTSGSGIYLPCPDKPSGIFHNVMDKGVITFDTSMRKFEELKDIGSKWNGGKQMRWRYPDQSDDFMRSKVTQYFNQFWDVYESFGGTKGTNVGKFRQQLLMAVSDLYHNLENLHPFVDGTGRTDYLVLNTLLCFITLHPVSLYNTMESALSSKTEERYKVLEGLFRWEETYANLQSSSGSMKTSWTKAKIDLKNQECDNAIAYLDGTKTPPSGYFVPDTYGGCLCANPSECSSGSTCRTKDCLWSTDKCAPGRSSKRK